MINDNNDIFNIFMISETMLDEIFTATQFSLQGFWDPYRFDRNRNGGGIMLYIREGIPSRLIEKKFRNNSVYFNFEINLRKKKLLLCCSYNFLKNSISTHIDFLRRKLNLHSSNYENFILLEGFNSEMTDKNLKDFCNLYLRKNLMNKSTCFKIPKNPQTIDFILTDRPRSFCNSDTRVTGLSDFHKLTLTITKSNQLSKLQRFVIDEISSNDILKRDLNRFLDAGKKSLNYQAPHKKK